MESKARTVADCIHAFFTRLESALGMAAFRRTDYRHWLLPDGESPIPRQERWERLRGIREKSNTGLRKELSAQVGALVESFEGISEAYWLAKPDLEQIRQVTTASLSGRCAEAYDDAMVAGVEMLRCVIRWHANDSGYWQYFTDAGSDENAEIVREQLEKSDAIHPLYPETHEALLRSLRVARGHLLRQAKDIALNGTDATSGKATTGDGSPTVGDKPEADRLADLKPCWRKAYLSHQYAETKQGRRLTDKEAWKYLTDYGIGRDGGELESYEVPLEGTYADYMNQARRHLNEPKYTPRGGRAAGSRSVQRRSEI